ncbi:MAG: hypothetical protein LUC88_03500 [Prevotella sp.]|nr:hypothetical protein [Prevotella sp.]
MNTVIRTLSQLQQVQSDTWVLGLIVAGVALAIAIGIAFLVNWRSDRRDFITRRIWFIIIGLVFPVAYWIYNLNVVVPQIQNAGFKSMYEETNLCVLIASIAAYFVVGIVLMLCFRNSKLGSILGKKKN